MEVFPTKDGDAELAEALVGCDDVFYMFLCALKGARCVDRVQALMDALKQHCLAEIKYIQSVRDEQTAPKRGKNGGVACDVTSGPCSCGAWH